MNGIEKLRHYLIDEMAKIDSQNLGGTYEFNYENLKNWNDFSLLQYWMEYNGVFDGGESLLMNLKTLIK